VTAPDAPHVLLVEDNELVTSALRILIESVGARVSIAASVAEALAFATADPPRLVLLDLTLPDGDGLSVIEPLRAAGTKTFVALTGHDDPETRQRCLDAGCVDVVVKPPRARDLVEKTTHWLSGTDSILIDP
jgi:two-component system KDP operon response regulator KdpE